MSEGWEYAPLFNMKFHAAERTTDLVRRRRWHRKMVAEDETASCFFSLSRQVCLCLNLNRFMSACISINVIASWGVGDYYFLNGGVGGLH